MHCLQAVHSLFGVADLGFELLCCACNLASAESDPHVVDWENLLPFFCFATVSFHLSDLLPDRILKTSHLMHRHRRCWCVEMM